MASVKPGAVAPERQCVRSPTQLVGAAPERDCRSVVVEALKLGESVLTKRKFRNITLCLALGLGSLMGVPMRAEEIEELLHQMNQPKIAHTLPDENDNGDPPSRPKGEFDQREGSSI